MQRNISYFAVFVKLAEEQEVENLAEPVTKKQFQQMRDAYDSTVHLVAALLQDRTLQIRIRMLDEATMAYQAEHKATQQALSGGQIKMAEWNAGRVTMDWYTHVSNSLATLSNPKILTRFGLLVETSEVYNTFAEWLEDDRDKMTTYFRLVVELASARVWSQQMFSTCFPYMIASVLHPSKHLRDSWAQRMPCTAGSAPGQR